METIKYISYFIAFVLIADFTCYVAWIFSGQSPVDGMFFGAITNAVLKYFLG